MAVLFLLFNSGEHSVNQASSYIFLVIVVVAVVLLRLRFFPTKQKVQKLYEYKAKDHVMTESEAEFFKTLVEVAGDRYYVFPQVHLSAILDHKISGQGWKYAFGHINGKSVDYVLCDKTTLKPVYAVELDDKTHERTDRIERDVEVERIFQGVNIPLVRFSNYKNLSLTEIDQRFFDAHSQESLRSKST